MSIKDRLSRLHESRQRGQERTAENEAASGSFSARDAVEYREPPDGSEPDREKAPRGPEREEAPTPDQSDGDERDAPEARIEGDSYPAEYRHGSIALAEFGRLDGSDLVAAGMTESPVDPSGMLFLDTETTGLSESDYAFCIGLGRWRETGFEIRHVVLTGPEAEADGLRKTAELTGNASAICTFNGRQFDLPLLERRAAEASVPAPVDDGLPHIDLLHVARERLPELENHRLGEVERTLLDFSRTSDLPGSAVPGVWSDYLEAADPTILEPVLEHNRLDIVSLCASLLALTPDPEDGGAERGADDDRGRSDAATSRPARRERADSTPPEDRHGGESRDEPGSVTEQLSRSYSLRNRSGAPERNDVSRETMSHSSASAGEERDDHAADAETPQQRTTRLRRRVESLLADENWSDARPLLYELAAIHPRHPYALEKLVELHERGDDPQLADHFRSRLRDVSPY